MVALDFTMRPGSLLFGGARYQTYGSHGCVNMPPASAGELYNLIQAGTPVICHY